MVEALAILPPKMHTFSKRFIARHDPRDHYLYISGAKTLAELRSTVHPVVRTHPISGIESLYVNDGLVGKIVKLSDSESDALLKMLYYHVANSVKIQRRVCWELNTGVFWDNRIVQYHAAFDYSPSIRKGYIETIQGEIPTL